MVPRVWPIPAGSLKSGGSNPGVGNLSCDLSTCTRPPIGISSTVIEYPPSVIEQINLLVMRCFLEVFSPLNEGGLTSEGYRSSGANAHTSSISTLRLCVMLQWFLLRCGSNGLRDLEMKWSEILLKSQTAGQSPLCQMVPILGYRDKWPDKFNHILVQKCLVTYRCTRVLWDIYVELYIEILPLAGRRVVLARRWSYLLSDDLMATAPWRAAIVRYICLAHAEPPAYCKFLSGQCGGFFPRVSAAGTGWNLNQVEGNSEADHWPGSFFSAPSTTRA